MIIYLQRVNSYGIHQAVPGLSFTPVESIPGGNLSEVPTVNPQFILFRLDWAPPSWHSRKVTHLSGHGSTLHFRSLVPFQIKNTEHARMVNVAPYLNLMPVPYSVDLRWRVVWMHLVRHSSVEDSPRTCLAMAFSMINQKQCMNFCKFCGYI